MSADRSRSGAPDGARGLTPPEGYKLIDDWPCKTCMSLSVAERCHESSDGAYEDYHFVCLDCGHSWWEESSDY
jgi:hypothetical protein